MDPQDSSYRIIMAAYILTPALYTVAEALQEADYRAGVQCWSIESTTGESNHWETGTTVSSHFSHAVGVILYVCVYRSSLKLENQRLQRKLSNVSICYWPVLISCVYLCSCRYCVHRRSSSSCCTTNHRHSTSLSLNTWYGHCVCAYYLHCIIMQESTQDTDNLDTCRE